MTKLLYTSILLLFPALTWASLESCDLNAIACHGELSVALEPDGTLTITPAMVLVGIAGSCNLSVSPSQLSCTDVGGPGVVYTLNYTDGSGNTQPHCWGVINVVDGDAPQFSSCPDNIVIPCDEDTSPASIAAVAGDVIAEDACGLASLTYTDYLQDNGICADNMITRSWNATDQSGNNALCVQTITLQVPTVFVVDWPASPVTLICETFPALPNGNPDPSASGEPDVQSCGQAGVVYEDGPVYRRGKSKNTFFIRTWTVFNWCDPSYIETFEQTINVIYGPCAGGPFLVEDPAISLRPEIQQELQPGQAHIPNASEGQHIFFEAKNESAVSIQPIPASTELIITFREPSAHQRTLRLLDLSGRTLRMFNPEGQLSVNIDISSWPAGLYILQLRDGKELESHKIVIE